MAATQFFTCLGGRESCESEATSPDRYRNLLTLRPDTKLIAQGSCLSLAGASFGRQSLVVQMAHFNRLLSFDPEGLTVTAEAGVTMVRLYEFLSARGLHVPVQPGHPDITLGGCIAANVHGKNQYREGVFADIVDEICLYHPRHGEMRLSAAHQSALFDLTRGGFGLTGVILWARIRIKPVKGRQAEISHIPMADLGETVDAMIREKDNYDLLYSWNDLATFGSTMGAGFLVCGNIVDDGATNITGAGPTRYAKLAYRDKAYPIALLNPSTLPLINFAYRKLNSRRAPKKLDGFSVNFPFASKPQYFYAYGRKGFLEHQVLVPEAGIESYIEAFQSITRRHRAPFGLASLKLFRGRRQLLWYTGDGISFSLHLPAGDRSLALLDDLDVLNSNSGAVTNLIKDPRISAGTARRQFPEYENFRDKLRAHDPDRIFASQLSERLEL